MCCLRHLVEDRGAGRGRRDAVDRDVVARQLLAERFGQRDDAGLRGRIGHRVRIALLAGDRGDVDDAAVVLRDHQRHDGAAAIELAVEIDAHHLVPGADRILPGRHVRPGDAGVVDQDVDAAERLHGGVARGFDLGEPRDVARHRRGLAADCASSPAACSASAPSRSQIATAAPDSSSRSTIARPMPCAPPVTTALRPLRSIVLAMS